MRVTVYSAYSGSLVIGVATPRDEALPSTKFQNATIHEDYAARVRALLKEHRHIGGSSLYYPAAKRLQNYFPVFPLVTGSPLYALRELKPAGSPRGVDGEWEVMSIRYDFSLNLLPAAHMADEVTTEGIERHLEFAVSKLFQANGVEDNYIPGDQHLRPGVLTEIDIRVELGSATARESIEIPTPV